MYTMRGRTEVRVIIAAKQEEAACFGEGPALNRNVGGWFSDEFAVR